MSELDNSPAPIEQAKTTEIALAPLASAIVATGKVDAVLAKQYPEVVQAYEPFFVRINEMADKASELQKAFDACETDIEKMAFAKDAKLIWQEAQKCLSLKKGGVELVKAELRSQSEGYVAMYQGGFNVCADKANEVKTAMKLIEKHEEVMQKKAQEKLDQDRKDQVYTLGGAEFLLDGEDCSTYTPEKWDERLGQIEGLVKLKAFEEAEAKRQAEAEAFKAKADAEKQAIRNARKPALARVDFVYDGDEAELNELGFTRLLETASAQKEEADKKAKRIADEKAKADAELARLRKAQAKADAEKVAQEKALQGSDAEKFKVLADKAKELMVFAEKIEGMQSDKGQQALDRFNTLIKKLSVDSFEQYNKLR